MLRRLRKVGAFFYYIFAIIFIISFSVVAIVLVLDHLLLAVGTIVCTILLFAVYIVGYLGRWKDTPKVDDEKIIYKYE